MIKKRVFIALIGSILYASFISGEQVPDYTKALYFDHAGQGGFCVNLEGKTICSVPSRAECELGDAHEGTPFGHLHYKLWFQQANGKYALYNNKGIIGQWDDLFPVSNAQYYLDGNFYFAYRQNNKWGILDKEGNVMIPAKYDAVGYSKAYDPEDLIIAKKGRYWGVVDVHEKIIIPFYYDSIIGSSAEKKGYFSVYQNKWGLVDDSSKKILACEYDEPIDVSKWEEYEIVPIKKNGKIGGLNKNGMITIPCSYTSLSPNGRHVYVCSKFGCELLNLSGKLVMKNFTGFRLLGNDWGLFEIQESTGKSNIVLTNLINGQKIGVYKEWNFSEDGGYYAGNYFILSKREGSVYKSSAFNINTGDIVTPPYVNCYAIDKWGRYALCQDTRTEKYYIWNLDTNRAVNEYPQSSTGHDLNWSNYNKSVENFTETYLHAVTYNAWQADIHDYKEHCTLVNHRGDIIIPRRALSNAMRYNAQVFGGILFAVRWDGENVSRIYDKQGNLLYTGDFHHINFEWKDAKRESVWILLSNYSGNKYDDRNVQYGYCLYENNVITEVVSCKFRRGDAERYLCQYLSSLSETSIEEDTPTDNTKLTSLVDKEIPNTYVANNKTIVLIIANENYKMMPTVPYALHDGLIFNEYCNKTLGVPKDNILYLSNATLNGIRLELDALKRIVVARNEAGYDSNIIVYYTGHGVPEQDTKNAYIMPIDGSESNLSTGYKLDDLYQQLGLLPAKTITVFLDACFSGVNRNDEALAQNKGARLVAKSGMPVGNMVVFAASQGNQTAFVNDNEQHGLFTYYLLKKIQETKGEVSLIELANYLKTEVKLKAAMLRKEQIPSIIASPQVQNQWQNWKLK